jgi:spore coat protein A
MSTIDDVTTGAATTEERSSLSRRNLLQLTMAGAAATAAGPLVARSGLLSTGAGEVQQGTVAGVISDEAPMDGPRVPKFERELLIPPVIEPTKTVTESVMGKEAKVDYYDVVQKVGYTDLLPAPFPKTQIWGYNGIYPGPTFRQTQNGHYTVVSQTNTLPASTSTHLHSSPTQPAHDGHPDDMT